MAAQEAVSYVASGSYVCWKFDKLHNNVSIWRFCKYVHDYKRAPPAAVGSIVFPVFLRSSNCFINILIPFLFNYFTLPFIFPRRYCFGQRSSRRGEFFSLFKVHINIRSGTPSWTLMGHNLRNRWRCNAAFQRSLRRARNLVCWNREASQLETTRGDVPLLVSMK